MANCTNFGRWAQPVFYTKPYLQSTKAVIQLSRKKEERGREEIIEKRRKEKKKQEKTIQIDSYIQSPGGRRQ